MLAQKAGRNTAGEKQHSLRTTENGRDYGCALHLLATQPLAVIKVASRVESPIGEVDDLARATADGEGEHEDHDLSSSVQCSGHEEVVLAEPTGAVATEVVLREDGNAEGREHGRVNTDTEVAERPAQNWRDDGVGSEFWELQVDKPEG